MHVKYRPGAPRSDEGDVPSSAPRPLGRDVVGDASMSWVVGKGDPESGYAEQELTYGSAFGISKLRARELR